MASIILFFLGLAVGSFINVLALRYKEDGRLISADIISGRSHCPYCGKTLRWYELIPLVSFFMQLGSCRHCHQRLTWQYPLVELAVGLAFLAFPFYPHPAPLWILAVVTLLLISLIDLRLYIIPDQLNWFLILLGLALLAGKGATNLSVWQDQLIGMFAGAAVFGVIVLLTRGRGMGLGDLKLAAALGFLFGWPDIILIVMIAFAAGGIVSLAVLGLRRKSLKDALPFGPFLAAAAVFVLLFGHYILTTYAPYLSIY